MEKRQGINEKIKKQHPQVRMLLFYADAVLFYSSSSLSVSSSEET